LVRLVAFIIMLTKNRPVGRSISQKVLAVFGFHSPNQIRVLAMKKDEAEKANNHWANTTYFHFKLVAVT